MELERGSRERIQEPSWKIAGCSEGREGGGGWFEEQAQVGSSQSFASSLRTRGIPFSPSPMSLRLSFICRVRGSCHYALELST